MELILPLHNESQIDNDDAHLFQFSSRVGVVLRCRSCAAFHPLPPVMAELNPTTNGTLAFLNNIPASLDQDAALLREQIKTMEKELAKNKKVLETAKKRHAEKARELHVQSLALDAKAANIRSLKVRLEEMDAAMETQEQAQPVPPAATNNAGPRCPVCMDGGFEYVFGGCGHGVCGNCLNELVNRDMNTCPTCRAVFANPIRVFF